MQELANLSWALAIANRRDERLFAALATAAERRVREFEPQSVANTAWAFATVNQRDEKLSKALAKAAERRLSALEP